MKTHSTFLQRFLSLVFGAAMLRLGVDDDGSGDGGAAAATAAAAAAAATVAAENAAAALLADGAKKPTDAEAKLLKEVMQKKEALTKTQADLALATERLNAFGDADPVLIKKLLLEARAADDAQLEAKGEFDRIKVRMADEHTRSVGTLQAQIDTLTAELSKKTGVVDELSIGSVFNSSGFIGDELTMTASKARMIWGSHFDLVDGKIVPFDKARGESSRTALVDARGEPVAFDDAMRKIVDTDPEKTHLLKSKMRPGSGSETKKTDARVKIDTGLDAGSKISAGIKAMNLMAQKAQ